MLNKVFVDVAVGIDGVGQRLFHVKVCLDHIIVIGKYGLWFGRMVCWI